VAAFKILGTVEVEELKSTDVWVTGWSTRALRIRSGDHSAAMFGKFGGKQKDILLQKESEFVAC
jgi:hypothetical protein